MKDDFEKQLLQLQLEIQEQTLNNISQEIHDNVGQMLSLAKIQLNIMEQRQTTDTELLYMVKDNIGRVMTDLRDIAKSLNSERLQALTLYEVIDQEIQRFNRGDFIKAVLVQEGTEQKMDMQKKLILFRIIQECLQNVLKHANAANVHITLRYGPEHLEIHVQDDGVGFDVAAEQHQGKGLGLDNITNRVRLISGLASVHSIIDKGTLIIIITPYA
ncbi:Histidine kinase [Chitinophaga rupis]|uniref:Oxygen sensor histidine kinase NreB n=2 Tax=Chitinophaga rupis TaxID=573321 RepID=A0A1H8A0V9_9BACT|nr:Histidine kinase [Chitinophaga rupis]